jgi:hypothetical protein
MLTSDLRNIPCDLIEGFVQTYHAGNVKIYYNQKIGLYKKLTICQPTQPFNIIEYFLDEKQTILHRIDGPAYVSFNFATNCPVSMSWYKNGIPHRDENEGPQTITCGFGIVTLEVYRKNGYIHRDLDQPALFTYAFNHNPEFLDSEIWYKNNKPHRDNHPARIVYNKTHTEFNYLKFGKLHRLDGPAFYIIENKNPNQIKQPNWYVNGKKIDDKKLPIIYKGKIQNKIIIDKSVLLEASMFDRDYGKFLLDFDKS